MFLCALRTQKKRVKLKNNVNPRLCLITANLEHQREAKDYENASIHIKRGDEMKVLGVKIDERVNFR